jgi:acyl-CoA dehydrogenase
MGLHLSTVLIAMLIILFALVDLLAGAILVSFMLIFLVIAIPLNFKPIRRILISKKIFKIYKKKLPKISETEEVALNAGDTWFEQGLFRGTPDWNKLHSIGKFSLSNEEQDFIKNETSQLCQMIDDWEVMRTGDLPIEVWQFMRDKGFFGLVIDKKFGGKGFSGSAHSQIVMRVASRSSVGSVTVMVPNSLGPGELLQHYGTI